MSSSPALSEPADHASPTPVSQRDEDAQYYRQVLHELIELGADLARTLHRQAAATPAAAPEPAPARALQPDPSIAFERIARTIRRTIALARKLSDPTQPRPAAHAAERRTAARKQIIRAVEDSIQRDAHSSEAEALHAELYERLETMDLDDDLDTLPIAEIIAAIRRDLGIAAHLPGTHPWKRRRPADVRALCARAAAPQTVQPRTPQPMIAQPRTTQPSTTHPRTGDPRPPAPPPRARTSTGPPAP